MANAQYSSFDRGFDLGHADVHPSRTPVIERRFISSGRSRGSPWKKIAAMGLMTIMLVSAIAIIVPMAVPNVPAPQGNEEDNKEAAPAIGSNPETTWTLSNMFESDLKSTSYVGDYTTLGHHTTTMGWNQWWSERPLHAYDDTMLRAGYPYVVMYSYYSANLPSNGPQKLTDPRMAFGTFSFYRQYIEAHNNTAVATGANLDPNFIPILNPTGLALNGGWVNWTWYLTYLRAQECLDIKNGLHYANTYYSVPAGDITFGGTNYNDGWWVELHGRMDFNRASAIKFLNLAGSANLCNDFNTSNAGNALGVAWASHWTVDGGSTGKFNIYNTYDFMLNSGQVLVYLSLDVGASSANKLVVRIWGIAWGYEILMERFLEVANIAKYQTAYAEDFYLNGTASPTNGDIHVRQTCVYKLLAWKDTGTWAPAWNIPTSHTDACRNDASSPAASWGSRYAPALPAQRYQATNIPAYHPNKMEWGPGTVNYGTRVMYWQAFQGFNLTNNQKIVVKLGNVASMGYEPFKSTSDVYIQDATKIAEMASHQVWGELVLGHGYPLNGPFRLNQTAFYNHATKTLTLVGPLNINTVPNANPTFGALNETGCPDFMFGVSKVSTYDVEITDGPPPYNAGQTYNLRVTARNFSGIAISNGTVNLACNNPGTTFAGGITSHTFQPAENGVWTTTVVFGSVKANTYINASSSIFPLDVNGAGGSWQVDTVIPEFSIMLMPVFMAAITLAVIAGRRRERSE